MPQFMKEIVAELTHLARRSHDVSQRSGVSVRMSVANYENIVSNATRRAIRLGEQQTAPRVSDLAGVLASTTGKIEIEDARRGPGRPDRRQAHPGRRRRRLQPLLLGARVRPARARLRQRADRRGLGDDAVAWTTSTSSVTSTASPRRSPNSDVGGNPAAVASAVEFILEGLHLNRRLNKDESTYSGPARYHR